MVYAAGYTPFDSLCVEQVIVAKESMIWRCKTLTPRGDHLVNTVTKISRPILMTRSIAILASLFLLIACDTPQPFTFGGGDGGDETEDTLDPRDPNDTDDNKFLFDAERGLTMNSVEYNIDDQELIINNLPFDGPDGRYINPVNLGGGQVFESIQTLTTGIVKHYAVYVSSDHIQGVAAAGENWGDFGYGGANIVRDSFSLPNEGEYVFTGDYLGVRTFGDRSGLEMVSADVTMALDILDFDPVEGVQGAIIGWISNRSLENSDGSPRFGATQVFLRLIEFTTDNGNFAEGSAVYYAAGTPDQAGDGTYEGFLAGTDAIEIGANIVLEGADYTQVVYYEVVDYEITTPEQVFVNPVTGMVTTIPATVVTGTASAANGETREFAQNLVDSGIQVGTINVDLATLPDGAVVTSTRIESEPISSTFNAREVGVIVAAQ